MATHSVIAWKSHIQPKAVAQYVVIAVCLFALPVALSDEYYVMVFQGLAITYVAVLGLNILTGYAGQASFGQAGFVAIGAYTSALLSVRVGLPFWIGLAAGPAVAAGVGALLALPAMRARGPFLVMITTGFGLAAWAVAANWVPVTGGPMGISGIPRPSLLDLPFDSRAYFYLAAAIALVLHIFTDNLMGSRWGRTLVALRDAPLAAESLGVNTALWKTAAFSLCAAYGGVAGVLMAHRTGFINSDSFTVYVSLSYVMVIIFGGLGTKFGPLVGTLVLGALPQVFAPLYDYYNIIFGTVVLLVLVLYPDGLVGLLMRLVPIRLRAERGKETLVAQPWRVTPRGGATGMVDTLLEIDHVTMAFGGLRALEGVKVSIQPGHVHGLMGPNGSGKTTLVNVITGFYAPTSGRVLFKGQDITRLRPHAIARLGIARTFQTPQLFGELTTLENVLIGFHTHMRAGFLAHLLHTPGAAEEEETFASRALGLLDFFGLREQATVPARNLAYGHQKLLEIARSMALQPSVLIMDEPAGGSGPAEIAQVREAVNRLKAAGITVLMIEHHTDLLLGITDRVTVLDFGRKIADGLPAVVRRDQRVVEAYLGRQEAIVDATG